jgi:glycolate oxidase iron-sulfur subunit
MALIEAVLKGRLPVSEIFRDRLATCTGCLACEDSCPSGVPVTAIIQAAKEEAVRESGRGIIDRIVSSSLTSKAVMSSLAWLAPVVLHYSGKAVKGKEHGAWGREQRARQRVMEQRRGKVAFFPGCAVGYFQHDIERATIRVLNAVGYGVIVPADLACCGRPLLSLGDRKAAEECAARNNRLFMSLGVDAVITACASCGLTFKKEYPTLLAPSGQKPVPILDIHEFLAGKMEGSGLAPAPMKVTYHDPCHLGRGQGLSKTARTVLRSVPGVEIVEMENPGQCCGFGGVMRVGHRGLSDRIGAAKAKDIIATRASIVVTGCPGCRMQIADSLGRAGSKAEVVHTVQVVEAALLNADFGMRNAELRTKEVEKVGR